MAVVFDPTVFDLGVFDTTFQVPTLLDFWVDREFKKVALGQVVMIQCRIVTLDDFGKKYLFNPATPPTLTLTGPDKIVRVLNGGMQNVALGVYRYRYQTGVAFDATVFDSTVFDVAVRDIPGVYKGTLTAREGNYGMKTLDHELFEIVSEV